MPKPLSELRVLDLTRLLPGGFCTMMLADLGADVLKVEEPERGDYYRWIGEKLSPTTSSHFVALNRGKRSITLNLKKAAARDAFLRLSDQADVVVESFRPGVTRRLGVDYESLSARNQRLIYCSISGYGQDGPYRDRAGHDINYIGLAGALDITGPRNGKPVLPGVQIADLGGGAMMAAVGILAAVVERELTGRGRLLDISMLDGVLAWMSTHIAAHSATGEVPERGGTRLSGGLACYRVYECMDGKYVALGALEDHFWETFCKAIGVPEFAERRNAPIDEQDAMAEKIQELLLRRTRDEWVRELGELDTCLGPVNSLPEALADPHVAARAVLGMTSTPRGPHRVARTPLAFGEDRGEPKPAAPELGEHTAEALAGVGYTQDDIAWMKKEGAV